MKKIITYVLSFIMLFAMESVSGQGYTFKVLANKGANKTIKSGSKKETPLKTGAILANGDMLVTSAGTYVGLMHRSGKTIEIRKAGTFAVTDLEKEVKTGSSSVASRYGNWVLSKLEDKKSGNYRSRLKATGAVSRAIGDGSLDVMIPEGSKIIGDKMAIVWEEESKETTWVVTIRNLYDDVIFEKETNQTKILVDLSVDDLADAEIYLITVKDKNSPNSISHQKDIERVTEGELLASVNAFKAEVAEDSPLSKLIYASFYEENGLLLDAMTKYEEAIAMSPDVPDFREIYDLFLLMNGLTIE